MPTVTPFLPRHHARNFALRALGWSVVLFGLLRLRGVEHLVLLPLTRWQGRLAAGVFGPPAWPIDVTLACSGADAIALCTGFILAYPARWRARIAAVAGGIGLILVLNTVRIGTLGLVRSQWWFELLHLYVWPALLIIAIAGYAFTWMTRTDVASTAVREGFEQPTTEARSIRPLAISRRFVVIAGAGLVLFTAAAPLYLGSAAVLAVAGLMARAAADLLRLTGVEASATANVLWTTQGGFVVTQECITTPLIPLYVAGVIAYSAGWRRRILLLIAAVPLFVALGTIRLLVVALPPSLVDSPLLLVHAFYQILLAGFIVWLAAVWRHGAGAAAWQRAATGAALGTALVLLLHPYYTPALAAGFPFAIPPGDPQGAMALLPPFQLGLFGALCVGAFAVLRWQLVLAGLLLLGLSQVLGFAVLDALQRRADVVPHVQHLRAWALAAPVSLILAMARYDRPRR